MCSAPHIKSRPHHTSLQVAHCFKSVTASRTSSCLDRAVGGRDVVDELLQRRHRGRVQQLELDREQDEVLEARVEVTVRAHLLDLLVVGVIQVREHAEHAFVHLLDGDQERRRELLVLVDREDGLVVDGRQRVRQRERDVGAGGDPRGGGVLLAVAPKVLNLRMKEDSPRGICVSYLIKQMILVNNEHKHGDIEITSRLEIHRFEDLLVVQFKVFEGFPRHTCPAVIEGHVRWLQRHEYESKIIRDAR